MRLWLARLVCALHLGATTFLALAWSLPWTGTLWAAVVAYPLVQLHWWSYGNRCVLSVVEERLRGEHAASRDAGQEDPARGSAEDEPLHFVSRLLGRPVGQVWGDAVSYAVIWAGFLIASLRLYARYRGAGQAPPGPEGRGVDGTSRGSHARRGCRPQNPALLESRPLCRAPDAVAEL